MSTKHFISLADAVRPLNLTTEQLSAIAAWCKAQNPRFKADRWYGYIDGENGPRGGYRKQRKHEERTKND